MESSANYTLVGLVTLGLAVLGVFFALWLGDYTGASTVEYYTVYFKNQSTEGLQVDGVVTMKGIRVGKVSSLAISSDNIEQVRTVLELDASTPIKQDSRAVIKRNLLTGLAWIDITSSTNESPRLQTVFLGEQFPVIREGTAPLAEITDTLPETMADASEVINRVKTLLSDENQDNIRKTLAHVEQLTGALSESRGDIKNALNNLSEASVAMKNVAASLDKTVKVAEESMVSVRKAVNESLQSVGGTADALRNTSSKLTGSVESATAVLTQQLISLGAALGEAARSTSAAMSELRSLDKRILGPAPSDLGPGETVP